MIGAIVVGLVAGGIARAVIPGDVLERFSGPVSWLLSLILGLVGAWLGWWIFTGLLGIGDAQKFDLGGIVGAVIGALIVLLGITVLFRPRRG